MESVVYSMFFRIDPLVIWHSPSLSVSQVDSSSSPLSHVPETEISETGVPVPSTTTTVTSARQVLPCSIIGGSADPIESDFVLDAQPRIISAIAIVAATNPRRCVIEERSPRKTMASSVLTP